MTRAPEAFAAALAAEHAAIFGYGVVGARADKTGREAARQAEAAHRTRRDALVVRLTGAGATPAPAHPAYALPFPVSDRMSALALAIELEERTAGAWRDTVPATEGEERRIALEAFMDCAVRATRWRRLAGVLPATVPYPGTPE